MSDDTVMQSFARSPGEFTRYRDRLLLQRDARAAGMLERLYIDMRASGPADQAQLQDIRYCLVIALCVAWRNREDIEPFSKTLTGEVADEVVREESNADRREQVKLLMSLPFKWMRWAAAHYAISNYRLK